MAGPVVAAAVMLPARFRHKTLKDSKQLSEARREEIYSQLTQSPKVCWAVSVIDTEEIDLWNILRASQEAMRRAVSALFPPAQHALIDGLPVHPFPLPHTAVIDGDCQSFSIAAASVIAKVTRDRIMVEMDARYPGYEFAQHKGYCTTLHMARLQSRGPCPIHRRSFSPVAQTYLPF